LGQKLAVACHDFQKYSDGLQPLDTARAKVGT
jgi:hypothetical protein